MIRLRDALTLSVTKLKTRRVRLIVTTLVSGLFFVLLAFASLVFNGATKSIEDFSEDGFGKRYIAQVASFGSQADYGFYEDKDVIAKAKQADKDLIAAKKAEAKRLGIQYDPNSEPPSVTASGPNGGEYLQPTRQTQKIIEEYKTTNYKSFFDALDQAVKEYEVKGVYHGIVLSNAGGDPSMPPVPTLSPIEDGKEVDTQSAFNNFDLRGFDAIANGLTALDDEVVSAFTLEGQGLAVGEAGEVPVIAPFSAAEEALGFARLAPNATSEQKLERLKEVRAQAAGVTFEACLRNPTSLERRATAQQQQDDYQRNKDKKDYRRPELMYDVSPEPCADVVVVRDVRTTATKTLDAKQQQFEETFGKAPAAQRKVTFKIVGITADPPGFSDGFSVKAIITSIISSNLGSGWFVPMSAMPALPEYEPLYATKGKQASFQNQILVEFANATEAKRFVEEQSCEPDFMDGGQGDTQKMCEDKGTPFYVSSFGSNSVALDDARRWFGDFFVKASLVIAIISAFIMMGTVGKVIADSRRETAVFRAIGAKRIDIASVYLLYSLLLGLIVVVFSLGAGFLVALWLDSRSSADVTVHALTLFNSQDLSRDFRLVGINASQLLRLAAAILIAGVASSILPLFNNLKRNPIKDMRDER